MAYNVLFPVHLIAAGDMSLTSITSDAVNIQNQDNVGIQLNWTGAPTGTFAFQVSMDHKETANGVITVAGHWVNLTVSPAIAAAGSPDSAYVGINQIAAPYIRVVYTMGSGSGSLDVFVGAKGV